MALVEIKTRESKRNTTKCDCCGEFIRTCQNYTYVKDYGKHCLSDDCQAALMDSLELNGDRVACEDEDDGERGLRQMEHMMDYRHANGGLDAYYQDRDAGLLD